MDQAQFQATVRQHVRTTLPVLSKAMRQNLSGEAGIEPRHLFELGDLLSQHSFIKPSQAPKLNELVIALYKNEELDEMVAQELQSAFDEFPTVPLILSQLAEAPESVSEQDFQFAINTLVKDDRFLFKYMRAAFTDRDIRLALDIPKDLDIDKYIEKLKTTLLNARDWNDLLAMRADGEFLGSFACGPNVCVAAFVIYAVATVVQTGIALVSYVGGFAVAFVAAVYFATVSTSGIEHPSTVDAAYGKMVEASISSYCINATSRVIWVVGQQGNGRKRFPVLPGSNSIEAGLARVHAVLVGGEGNPLSSLRGHGGEVWQDGAYLVSQADGRIVPVILVEEGGEVFIKREEREILPQDASGKFITSELQSADGDMALTLRTVAAAYPVGFDVADLAAVNKGVQRFYKSQKEAFKLARTKEVLFAQ